MLKFENISKTYYNSDGSIVKAIEDISLSVSANEFVAFVGPSGCGKTAILRIIAGLEKPTAGKILFEDKEIDGTDKKRGMVFQNYTYFPWLTVSENIGFGLRLNKVDPETIKQKVEYYLQLTGLEKFANVYPMNLSGGMRQRVALARSLANDPKILLLDEPFGALDVQTRHKMQTFLAQIREKERRTFILITHDVEEALFLADTIYVLSNRPAHVKNIYNFPLDRPHQHDLIFTQEFFDLRKKISQELEI